MSGSQGGGNGGEIGPEEREAYERRLTELGKRLDEHGAARGKAAAPNEEARRNRAAGQALQMALDLVLGPLVGAGIGWGLDKVLGSGPWLLLVFLCLGIAAGITNLVRTYRQIMAESGGDLGRDLPAGRDGDDD